MTDPEKADETPKQPKPSKPRFLAPKGRRGDGLGYVDNPHMAMREEPECLSAQEWRDHVEKRADTAAEQLQKFEDRKREEARRLLTFEERLTAAMAHARTAKWRADISSEVRLLRQMQAAGKEVRHLEKRLHMIERKVWREAA